MVKSGLDQGYFKQGWELKSSCQNKAEKNYKQLMILDETKQKKNLYTI